METYSSQDMAGAVDDNSGDHWVWNFAYGSNMHPDKRHQRASMNIIEVLPASVPDWKLVFDLQGISFLEPSMASISPAPGDNVHGVLLKMSRDCFDQLVRSEGGDNSYERITVTATTYDGREVKALAFKTLTDRQLPGCQPPSLRYLTILRDGAKLSGLNGDYCQRLKDQPCARLPKPARLIGETLFSTVMLAGRHGFPGFGPWIFRTLRRIDQSTRFRFLRWPLTTCLLFPILVVGTIYRLILKCHRCC